MAFTHESVLSDKTMNALTSTEFGAARADSGRASRTQAVESGVFVDGTFGRGGHSRQLLARLGDAARLLVFDKDPEAISVAEALAREDARVVVIHAGFGSLDAKLAEHRIEQIDGLMLDLGMSSPQVDDARRGFSFMREGPLDMRMDPESGMSAAQWLSHVSLEELKEVISRYGEERFAFKIAKAIISRRESRPLRTTYDLAELVSGVVRTREKGQHPATRTFQAIRIHINQELQELAHALTAALKRLSTGGRLAVISFHSLEDRMIKQFIAATSRPGAALARLPIPERDMPPPLLLSLGRYRPQADEIRDNPRARSAILRVAQRTAAPLPADASTRYTNTAGLVSSALLERGPGDMPWGA